MKFSPILPWLCLAGLSLFPGAAQAANEDAFLEQIQPSPEQIMGQGQSALWTLPLVATQYQPLQPTPVMQAAMQAQQENRFLDALILLEDADKRGQVSADARDEMNLLRASFLLQGNQTQQAIEILAHLFTNARHAADAYALTAMAHLQQGQMQEALKAAQHAQQLPDGMLPHLVLSYVLQGNGRLTEAHQLMHDFNTKASNTRTPQHAIALAREAELALTLNQIQPARTPLAKAQAIDAKHPYVTAVSGLAYLIDGQTREAKAAFETALQRNPKDAKALLGLGLAEIRLGNFQTGQKILQAANEAEPGNALILTYLGRAQQQSGQTGAARASWRSAQQADPKDPTPWLYQAQAELQANRPLEARESLRQAEARTAYRAVYRGEKLLREDAQLLQANLAEIQRQLEMESLAFQTLSTSPGEKNALNLRNQADLLQGQRFGESARRSLLLQSQFDAHPGSLPAPLDTYGDGAGQTGAANPQHGEVSTLNAQQVSYHNYDELFSRHTTLEADAIGGSKGSAGAQLRAGFGNDTLGLSFAQREYRTDGFARFDNLDNRVMHASVQWRPAQSTQAFVSHQTFDSQHGENQFPADAFLAAGMMIEDNSQVTRLGLRHSLSDNSELRALWSRQTTNQVVNQEYLNPPLAPMTFSSSANSSAHSTELQYRTSGADHTAQWGMQKTHAHTIILASADNTRNTRQLYAAWQQALNPQWQLDAQLNWGSIDNQDNTGGGSGTYLKRWLPKLGLVYTPDSGTHVRAAAWRGMGFGEIGDASLAPVSLAGILLTRPDDNKPNGMLIHGAALGADKQLSRDWLLEGQTQRRRTQIPTILAGQQNLHEWQINESRLALHWQPARLPWSLSLAYEHERFLAPPMAQFSVNDSVQEQRLRAQQLALRWFACAHATLNLAWSHNRVDGNLQTNFWADLLPYQNGFNQVDTSLNWQFNRRGALDVGVRNATDKRFQYTDIDRLNPRFSNGKLIYAKFKLNW